MYLSPIWKPTFKLRLSKSLHTHCSFLGRIIFHPINADEHFFVLIQNFSSFQLSFIQSNLLQHHLSFIFHHFLLSFPLRKFFSPSLQVLRKNYNISKWRHNWNVVGTICSFVPNSINNNNTYLYFGWNRGSGESWYGWITLSVESPERQSDSAFRMCLVKGCPIPTCIFEK